MKSIKFKILTLSMSLLLVSILLFSVSSVFSMYNSTMFALKESMSETIDTASDLVEIQLDAYRDMAKQFAVDPIISQKLPEVGETTSDGRTYEEVRAEIMSYFEELQVLHNFEVIQHVSTKGIALTHGTDFSNEPMFTVPRDTGMAYVSDPILSPTTGQLTMTTSAPIVVDGEFRGVAVLAINPAIFSEIASRVEVGEGSTTTIINSKGDTIAFNDIQLVFDSYNTAEEAKSDPSLQVLADVEQSLAAGEEGFETVTWDGIEQFVAYKPINNSNGWGIYALTPRSNFLAQMFNAMAFTAIMSVAILIVATIITIKVTRNISSPVTMCAQRLDKVAEGDLKSPLPTIEAKDETGVLAKSTATIVNSISEIIADLNYVLSEIAGGNFAVESRAKDVYIGDFASLRDSLQVIVKNLSLTMEKVNIVSLQVNMGNEQLAQGAQSLAEGSIKQAVAIDELSTTISKMTLQMDKTATDSKSAQTANDKSKQSLVESNKQMSEMVTAMGNINNKSIEISNIIKTINDIAFQTNILALNAAVEAARAGSAGKGFAVVADEVRSLATKSAQSAKDIADLIEETASVVHTGNKIAKSTSESINTALESAHQLSELVESIAISSITQAEGAKEIKLGIEQISTVIQTNSATAEESAATSVELSNQSQVLKSLLLNFKLSGEEVTSQGILEDYSDKEY